MKEAEIRPREILNEYQRLVRLDAEHMQQDSGAFIEIDCPGCGGLRADVIFHKNGFPIRQCLGCGSIYCSPRPNQDQLNRFYADSPSSQYWADVYFPTVAEVRREKMFRPKAKRILEICEQRKFQPGTICDVGAGHGYLLEELTPHFPTSRLVAVEPSQQMADVCRDKGFDVIERTVEQVGDDGGIADLVICFEVIEHACNPRDFLRGIFDLTRPGGYCLITGLGGDGFDIQVLGEFANSIFPPHHINFLSVRGFEALFRDVGFVSAEVTTPGKLDVDIVKNSLAEHNLAGPPFVRTLLARGEEVCRDFQKFLVEHKLSSHVWVFARKGPSHE